MQNHGFSPCSRRDKSVGAPLARAAVLGSVRRVRHLHAGIQMRHWQACAEIMFSKRPWSTTWEAMPLGKPLSFWIFGF